VQGIVCWHRGDLTHQYAYFWRTVLAQLLGTTSLALRSGSCPLVLTGSLCVLLQPAQLGSPFWWLSCCAVCVGADGGVGHKEVPMKQIESAELGRWGT
jgi:hypothetical protein